MNDLIFVVRNDGTYESVPNKNLRAQENYSDNFVVIANQVGVVKAKIKLLSRTDKVEVKYLVPSLESVADLIGDKPFFQDYANASVWRGAVPKKLLQEISMSYAGNVEVSFSFLKAVLDSRATELLGELQDGEDLPQSATEGDYFIIRYASYTANDITWTYGQTAIWVNGEWVKGGTYQVIGTTTTHRMNVEQTLKGEQAEFDVEQADEILTALGEMAGDVSGLVEEVNDHELRITTAEEDIDELTEKVSDIESGDIVVEKANKDSGGRKIDTTYISNVVPAYYQSQNKLDIISNTPYGIFKYESVVLPLVTQVYDGLMTADDKTKLDNLITTILGYINAHDTESTAHLYLRNLIGGLQSEIDRLDGKGKSYGEIDKTQSELLALGGGITAYINTFLGNKFPSYNPSNGDLIYTKEIVGENVHEWEYNAAITTWVDNGAYTVEKASNSEYGLVKGDGTFVSIVSGIIEVLRAKTADKIGTAVDFYTKGTLDAAFTARYTKTEVDNLLNQLKAVYGWEDSLLYYDLGESMIVKDFDEFRDYTFLFIQAHDTSNLRQTDTQTISVDALKKIEIRSGKGRFFFASEDGATFGEVEFDKDGGDDKYKLYFDGTGDYGDTYYSVYGVKILGLDASQIPYDINNSVGDELLRLEEEKADATNKATILGAITQANITGSDTSPKLISGKEIKDYAEPKVLDSGWVDLSLINVESVTYAKVRKIGNLVNFKIKAKRNNVGNENYANIYFVPVGYRTLETNFYLYNLTDNIVSRVYTGGNDLYVFVGINKEFTINITYIVN